MNKINPRGIILLALIFWVGSLFLPGLATYDKTFYGYQILAMGWLGPLVMNFAWYANIFFWFATIKLLRNKSIPKKTSLLAVILSTNMFFLSELLLNEGGATTPIYGYGTGSILWMISMLLVFFASSLKTTEQIHNPFYKNVSFILIIILTTSSIWLAIQNRVIANPQEKERLSRVLFKRGPVCSAEVSIPKTQLVLNGPLELISDKKGFLFYDAEQLLKWGIPAVRIEDEDYYIGIIADKPTVTSRPAHGLPAAILESNFLPVSDHTSFAGHTSLKMYSPDRKVIIFDQTWNREHLRFYCPDYRFFPNENEQPRKLIMSALKIIK